jgi:hypothetical protein
MISSYIVVYHGYLIDQLDDHNIFLNEIFQEEVYMKQSSGFIHPTISFHICHFYLYGLKQAYWVRFNHLSVYLLFIGFHTSKMDTFLFTLFIGDDIFLLTCVYWLFFAYLKHFGYAQTFD